jgi:hypothetical protein
MLSLKFEDLTEKQKNSLKITFDELSEDDKQELKGRKGDRGLKGSSGESFSWEESKEDIEIIISNYFESIKNSLKLSFSDLTEDEISSLRGPRGLKGQKGSSFNWDARKEDIFSKIKEFFDLEKDSLKLKFEDLSEDDVLKIVGPRGPKGQKGNSFDWDIYRDSIYEEIRNLIKEEKDSLKLKFEDFTESQLSELKGPRGSKGQRGSSFNWDARKEDIFNQIKFYFDSEKNDLKIKFEDLTQEEKDSFKLRFSDLTREEIDSLRGPRGLKGQRGKQGEDAESPFDIWKELGNNGSKQDFINALKVMGPKGIPGVPGTPGIVGQSGRNGQDGVDAPIIIDVEIVQKKEKFFFIFHFDNNTFIETEEIKLPSIKKVFRYVMAFAAGSSNSVSIQDESADQGSASVINFVGDSVTATVLSGVATITVDPGDGDANNVLRDVDCDSSVFIGAAVRMNSSGVAINAKADNQANSNVIGIAESKSSSVLCNIRVAGVTGEIFTGLDVTKLYHLSEVTSGNMQTGVPVNTGEVKIKIGQPFSDKKFLVQKGEPTVMS